MATRNLGRTASAEPSQGQRNTSPHCHEPQATAIDSACDIMPLRQGIVARRGLHASRQPLHPQER